VLEILFAHSDKTIDAVRQELPKFGYTGQEIEENFTPIMILRNHFDVGHVTTKLYNQYF
jgi:hypothetical protein